jgi:hypothetical protein
VLYDHFATLYRSKGIGEEERSWQKRSEEETNEYLAIAGTSAIAYPCTLADDLVDLPNQGSGDSTTDPTAVLIAAASHRSSLDDSSPFASGDPGADARTILESTSAVLADDAGAPRVERLAAWSLQIQATRTLWRLNPSDQSLLNAYQESIDHALGEATVREPSTRFEQALADDILANANAFYATVAGDPSTAALISAQSLELTTSTPSGRLPLVTPSSLDCR